MESKQFTQAQDDLRRAMHAFVAENSGGLDVVEVAYVVAIAAGEMLGVLLSSIGVSEDDIVEGASMNIRFGVQQAVKRDAEIDEIVKAASTDTKKAAIAIDPWKLSIFERHLTQAGYTFTNAGNISPEALLLRVDTTNLEALGVVLEAANTEAARTGEPRP